MHSNSSVNQLVLYDVTQMESTRTQDGCHRNKANDLYKQSNACFLKVVPFISGITHHCYTLFHLKLCVTSLSTLFLPRRIGATFESQFDVKQSFRDQIIKCFKVNYQCYRLHFFQAW